MAERNQPATHVSVVVLKGRQLLLVREEKPALHGLWNLPGGHLERGESLLQASQRELVEETHIDAPPTSLVGIYSTPGAVRFVFAADAAGQTPSAGDEILDVRYVDLDELATWPDASLVGPLQMRRVLQDIDSPRRHGLEPFVFMPV